MKRTLVGLLLSVVGSVATSQAGTTFVSVEQTCGLVHTITTERAFNQVPPALHVMQLNMGNGGAVGDYDGDGDLDIYLVGQVGKGNILYQSQVAQGSVSFLDVTAAAGVDDLGLGRLGQFADLDNDTDLDLILVNDVDTMGQEPNSKIFRNNGNGTFTDVTPSSGFVPIGWLRNGLSVADYDRDGLLDIYVTVWAKAGFLGHNRLYRNNGNFSFTDVTFTTSGLGPAAVGSFASLFHDFDGDLYPDLYVAVDAGPDLFYWNNFGVFTADSAMVGTTHIGNEMGADVADFDNDGDLDIYSTNITDPEGTYGTGPGNIFYVNDEDSTGTVNFTDEALARGADDSYWGWGTEFTDFDNDGDLDILAVSGMDSIVGSSSVLWETPAALFENDGNGQFTRLTPPALDTQDDQRGFLAFDFDRDGDEDFLITNIDSPVRLIENQTTPSGNWLGVELRQLPGENRLGIGATIEAVVGGVTRRRELLGGNSYVMGGPPEVHFGLGTNPVLDELRVRWTDGTVSTYPFLEVDRFVTIEQGVSDSDIDGVVDGSDNCQYRVNPNQDNGDTDLFGDACDCADGDSTLWALPTGPIELSVDGGSATDLSWTAVSDSGGAGLAYDLVRATDAGITSGVSCLAQDLTAPAVQNDNTTPGLIYYYLARARNGCGELSGLASSGASRTLPGC